MSRGLFRERGSTYHTQGERKEERERIRQASVLDFHLADPLLGFKKYNTPPPDKHSHLAIWTGDLREDAHHGTDEMEESHGCCVLIFAVAFVWGRSPVPLDLYSTCSKSGKWGGASPIVKIDNRHSHQEKRLSVCFDD